MNSDDIFKNFNENKAFEVLGKKVNPEALHQIYQGDHALRQNNYSEAIILFSQAINLDNKNPYPFTRRGKCYQMTKQYDKALEDLFKSKSLDDNFSNNQTIAECYLFKKEYSRAIRYFDEAVKKLEEQKNIDSGGMMGIDYGATKARTLNNQAVCYFHLNKFDEAINCSSKGIEANANYPNNYSIRAISYLQLGMRNQGINDLKKAAQLGDIRAESLLSQI